MTGHRLLSRSVTDPAETERDLSRLLVSGPLADPDLELRVARLAERFRVYTATIPFGLWDEGLAVTSEMRATTELLLPLDEVRRAFRRLLRLSLRPAPPLDGTPLQTAATWLDCLERLDHPFRQPNPAHLIARLAADEELRIRFLFSLFVPRRHGASFDRYPGQASFLREWLRKTADRRKKTLLCLDAACGAGEGTYGLARLFLDEGLAPSVFRILGTSRDPIEIFSASHGFFPHDPSRQEAFRLVMEELRAAQALGRIGFAVEDLNESGGGGSFDIILCNGILGGPFVHGREVLERMVAGLAARLAPDGVLCAADRFHGGWKRVAPATLLGAIMEGAGLETTPAGEGMAGIRRG